jgi:hypothetical protein
LQEKRVDRRRAEYQNGKRRVVVGMRERNGRTVLSSPCRKPKALNWQSCTLTAWPLSQPMKPAHWDMLHAGWEVERVNHSEDLQRPRQAHELG